MFRNPYAPVLALILASGFQQPLKAQMPNAPEIEAQAKALYAKLSTILAGDPEDKTFQSKSSMLVLANPGLPLSDNFNTDILDDQIILDSLADQVLQVSPRWTAIPGATLSGTYSKLLEYRQAKDLPPVDPATKKRMDDRLAEAQDITKYDGPYMQAYLKFRGDYLAACAVRDDAELAKLKARNELAALKGATGPESTRLTAELNKASTQYNRALEDVKLAKNLWINNGFKAKVEGATATIQSINSGNGDSWWAGLLDRLEASRRGDGLKAIYVPSAGSWQGKNAGWTKFSFKYGEQVDDQKLNTESWNVAGKAGYKAVSLEGKFSKADMTAASLLAHKDLEISFELMRVLVLRKWYEGDVLRNSFWTLPANIFTGPVSYGDLKRNLESNPAPALPTIISELVLCRNLLIKTHLDRTTIDEFQSTMNADGKIGAKISMAMVTLSGGYDSKDKGKKTVATFSESGISCPGVQIIGAMVVAPPKSPAASVK